MPYGQADAKDRTAPARGRFSVVAALLLSGGFAAYLIGIVTDWAMATAVSAVLILCFIALNLAHASGIVKFFACAATAIAVWGGATGALSAGDLGAGAGRLGFLSSILIALIFLRLVAGRDPAFAAAGSYLASQPPSRRYVSLGIGGNLFGVLLNLGGLGLLIEMTLAGQRRIETANQVSDTVHAIRERRIVSSIIRGFATIAYWSPFGIALNTLLLIFGDVHWIDAAPWGIGFAILFMGLGAGLEVLDRTLHPVFPRPKVIEPDPTDRLGLVVVLAHLFGLGALVIAVDAAVALSFQQVLVLVVPVYAAIYAVLRGGIGGVPTLIDDFTTNAPRYVNEVGVFALAGLIGAFIVALVPQHALDPILERIVATGGPTLLALALMWATLVGAMLGLHPIIGVVILGEFMSRTDLLPQLAAVMALLSGWTLTVMLAPLATTATYVGAILDRSPVTISLRWNGIFGGLACVVVSVCLVVAVHLHLFGV